MPLVRRRILAETRGVVLPAEDPRFGAHVDQRKREGIGLLVNPLGESILGDDEATRRVGQVLEKLRRPDVGAVSIKASALVANLDVLDFDRSIERISEPLREIYRAALLKEPRGFVNLDMEEYRDLQLTVAAFTKVLDEPEFHHLEAGIVLQAYLPDSHDVLEHLGRWASAASRDGGAADQDPDRQRRQPGDGGRRGRAARLGRRAVPDQGRCRCQLQADARVGPATRVERRRSRRRRQPQPVRRRLGAGAPRPASGDQRGRIELEMLEGMAPAQSRAVHARGRLRCCSTRRSCSTIRSTPASPTCRGDSTRTRRPRTSCGRCSRSRPGSPEFVDQADRFRRVGRRATPRVDTPRRRGSRPHLTMLRSATNPTATATDRRRPRRDFDRRLCIRRDADDRSRPIVDTLDGDRRRSSHGPSPRRASWAATRCRPSVGGCSPRSPTVVRRGALRHDRGDGRRSGQGRSARATRRSARQSTSPRTTAPSASTSSSSSAPRAPHSRRAVSSWWPRRGTSPTPSPPAACSPRWPPATP